MRRVLVVLAVLALAVAAPVARVGWGHRGPFASGEHLSFGVLIAVLGGALWIGGAFHLTRRGLDAGDRLVRRDAAAAAVLVVVGLVVWVAGLYNT